MEKMGKSHWEQYFRSKGQKMRDLMPVQSNSTCSVHYCICIIVFLWPDAIGQGKGIVFESCTNPTVQF